MKKLLIPLVGFLLLMSGAVFGFHITDPTCFVDVTGLICCPDPVTGDIICGEPEQGITPNEPIRGQVCNYAQEGFRGKDLGQALKNALKGIGPELAVDQPDQPDSGPCPT